LFYPDPVSAESSYLDVWSSDGGVRASLDRNGGGIRALEVNGCPIVDPYPAGRVPPHAAGAVLFPWPNRVRDGRWSSDGVEHQLLVNEPELDNASHGLVRGHLFSAERPLSDTVCLTTTLGSAPGYPFEVSLAITYQALHDGLRVSSVITNQGPGRAPVALGFHPYLRIGDTPMQDLTLEVPAGLVLDFDARLLPVGSHETAEPRHLPLREAELNHCYGKLDVVEQQVRHRLLAPDGRSLEMRTDPSFGWVQVFTNRIFPRDGQLVSAIAVEPMTAPPDALNSGTDLIWLEPGQDWSGAWSLHLTR
jgi:aldose 1-epimerase